MIIEKLTDNFTNCPLNCKYFITKLGSKIEVIMHLKEYCPKRLLLDNDFSFCEDPHNRSIIISDREEHSETCEQCREVHKSKCETINAENNSATYDRKEIRDNIAEDQAFKCNQSNIFPEEMNESKCDLKKLNHDFLFQEDAESVRTNYTSGYFSVNDTMINSKIYEKSDYEKFENSFYKIPISKPRRNGNFSMSNNKLNDTMMDDDAEANFYQIKKSTASHNIRIHQNLIRKTKINQNLNPNDTMIIDNDNNNSIRMSYKNWEHAELEGIEEDFEDFDEFCLEGKLVGIDQFKEYFMN
jgi:hypothetical protein